MGIRVRRFPGGVRRAHRGAPNLFGEPIVKPEPGLGNDRNQCHRGMRRNVRQVLGVIPAKGGMVRCPTRGTDLSCRDLCIASSRANGLYFPRETAIQLRSAKNDLSPETGYCPDVRRIVNLARCSSPAQSSGPGGRKCLRRFRMGWRISRPFSPDGGPTCGNATTAPRPAVPRPTRARAVRDDRRDPPCRSGRGRQPAPPTGSEPSGP
jgi:hypothetical protein